MSEQSPPPGWYPQGNEQRYWDGSAWTDQRAPLQAQPQYATPTQPEKKSHTVRNVLLALIALGVLVIGGCTAVVVIGVGDAVNDAVEADKEPGGPDNPMEITPGEAFEVNDFKYAAGWKVGKDALGDVDITGLKVTNERDDKDGALVEIKFWQGSEVVAAADCTTDQIDIGTTVTVRCLSADPLPKSFEKITINDTF